MVNSRYHILKEYANGVMNEKGKFFPFEQYTATATGTVISGRNGRRIFVKSVSLAGYNGGDQAAATVNITGYKDGTSTIMASVSIPATVAASNVNFGVSNFALVGVLLDPGTTLSMNSSATGARVVVIAAYVDEQEGEYIG